MKYFILDILPELSHCSPVPIAFQLNTYIIYKKVSNFFS